MGSWVAMIGSTSIGSLILLALLRFSLDFTRDTNLHALEHIAYSNLVDAAEVIQYDLSQIGLGINDSRINPIVGADSTSITYLIKDGDTKLDTVQYYLSDLSSAGWTDNPNDRFLYRRLNAKPPTPVAVGLTFFRFRYFDALGNVTSTLADIRLIEIELITESTTYYNNIYPKIAWHGRVMPKNLYGN